MGAAVWVGAVTEKDGDEGVVAGGWGGGERGGKMKWCPSLRGKKKKKIRS